MVAENRDSGTEPAGSLRARSTEESVQNELGIVPTIQLDFGPEDAAEQDKQEDPVLWVYEEDVHEDF